MCGIRKRILVFSATSCAVLDCDIVSPTQEMVGRANFLINGIGWYRLSLLSIDPMLPPCIPASHFVLPHHSASPSSSFWLHIKPQEFVLSPSELVSPLTTDALLSPLETFNCLSYYYDSFDRISSPSHLIRRSSYIFRRSRRSCSPFRIQKLAWSSERSPTTARCQYCAPKFWSWTEWEQSRVPSRQGRE
ncbi:hypothetical protein FB446DRAFT_366865 [Lentinula raphanica]|nr:hypothetical protein FB446DRAFT_366865 [Lentinula raphanica]